MFNEHLRKLGIVLVRVGKDIERDRYREIIL